VPLLDRRGERPLRVAAGSVDRHEELLAVEEKLDVLFVRVGVVSDVENLDLPRESASRGASLEAHMPDDFRPGIKCSSRNLSFFGTDDVKDLNHVDRDMDEYELSGHAALLSAQYRQPR